MTNSEILSSLYQIYQQGSRSVLECSDYISALKVLNFWRQCGIMVDVIPRANKYIVRPVSNEDEFMIRESLWEFENKTLVNI